MAVVLTAAGVVVYLRFEANLDATFNQGLRSRASDVSALIQRSDSALDAPGRSVLVEQGESFAQVLAVRGAVVDSTPKLQARPLLSSVEVRRAARETFIVTRPNPFESGEPARLLATPVTARGRRLIVVVGAGADDRNSQLATLALLLAISGTVALLLASLAGYGVASGALRPVEAMRRKAERITEQDPGQRLPVGSADDEIARLGTTLNGMLGRLELALRSERTASELREALISAAEETDRLADLAEALLVIARSDGGRLPLAMQEIDVAELLKGVGVRFGARIRASGRELVVDGEPAARLTADRRRVEQALDNLVENALRHGAGTIHLGVTSRGGCVELHVRDEGSGFAPQFIARAFERFTRGDHARARGGSGLGLAIVLTIARAHGGVARAANDPGGGARVSIALPVAGPGSPP